MILDHEDMEYMGTLCNISTNSNNSPCSNPHKQYPHDISLEEWFAIVFPRQMSIDYVGSSIVGAVTSEAILICQVLR